MSQTHLNLLTRDGAMAVVFEPALDVEHYPLLHEAVGKADSDTELRQAVQALADTWGRTVNFD